MSYREPDCPPRSIASPWRNDLDFWHRNNTTTTRNDRVRPQYCAHVIVRCHPTQVSTHRSIVNFPSPTVSSSFGRVLVDEKWRERLISWCFGPSQPQLRIDCFKLINFSLNLQVTYWVIHWTNCKTFHTRKLEREREKELLSNLLQSLVFFASNGVNRKPVLFLLNF